MPIAIPRKCARVPGISPSVDALLAMHGGISKPPIELVVSLKQISYRLRKTYKVTFI